MRSWNFDPHRLATALHDARAARRWSTRDLAEHSGLSQSYIATLERPLRRPEANHRVPTVTTLVQLAEALSVAPLSLLAQCLVAQQQHALLVYADHVDPLAAVRTALEANTLGLPERWLSTCDSPLADHRLDLRRGPRTQTYSPTHIEAALDAELHVASMPDVPTALVVTQQSVALTNPATSARVLSFETTWPHTVHDCARRRGASITWNVCAYHARHVARANGGDATVRALVNRHQHVWYAEPDGVLSGDAAIDRLLPSLTEGTS